MKHLASLFLFCAAGALAQTAVTQTVQGPDGQPANGRAVIQISKACRSGANYVGPAPIPVTITAGAFSVALVPNDTCVPSGTSYSVTWQLTSPAGNQQWTETWVVPTSSSPVTVDSVVVQNAPAPGYVVQLSQLSQNNAQVGWAPLWNGLEWAPGPVAVTIPVPAVFGRTGAITAQPGDYNTSQVTENSAGLYFTPARAIAALSGLYQSPITGAPGTWPAFATVATSGSYNDLSSKPSLAAVATSGSYTDLASKPAIPAAASTAPPIDGTAAAGASANYARADHVHPTDTSRQAAFGPATVFDCEFYLNINACLDAAKAFATTNESGSGHATRVLIPEGTFTITSPPYTLISGMQLVGVLPRVEYSAAQTPTLWMVPNGGTWLDCGGTQCFAGSNLRGVALERLGFIDFTTAAVSFGGNNVDGLSQSKLTDLLAVGQACAGTVCPSNIAFEVYNFADVPMNILQAYNVNVGLHLVSQSPWCCPGNSTITDPYFFTYPKSAANGNAAMPGIWLQALMPSSGTPYPLNMLTFIRPQVNTYSGDGTGVLFSLSGLSSAAGVNEISVIDADMEGSALNAFYLQQASQNFIRIATTTPATITNTVYLDTAAARNVFQSSTPNATVAMATPRTSGYNDNLFYGIYIHHCNNCPKRSASAVGN